MTYIESHVEQLSYEIKINVETVNNNIVENNRISTSHYRWFNFIPKILVEQFSKMANIYFLFIAMMQVSFFESSLVI